MIFSYLQEFNIPNVVVAAITILAAVIIILENKNPHKTIAWLLTIILLPILGIILYVFFGQTFRHRRQFRKKRESKEGILQEKSILNNDLKALGEFGKTAQFLETSTKSLITRDNKLLVLPRANSFFDTLLRK